MCRKSRVYLTLERLIRMSSQKIYKNMPDNEKNLPCKEEKTRVAPNMNEAGNHNMEDKRT